MTTDLGIRSGMRPGARRSLRLVSGAVAAVAVLGLGAVACGDDDESADDATTTTTTVDSETMMGWQRNLEAVGCYQGPIDGIEGEATFAAIEEFQRVEGIEVDGGIGSETEEALDSAYAEGREVCARAVTTTTSGETTTTTGGETTTTTGGETTTTTGGETTTTTSGETTTTTMAPQP